VEAELTGAAPAVPGPGDAYVVVGAGAIGGTIAAHLIRAGARVDLVERDPAHRAALRERGIVFADSVEDAAGSVGARPAAVLDPEEVAGVWTRVLLCVKSQDTADAAALIAARLAPDGFVVSCQNGDNETALIGALGADRVVGAFVNIAADVVGPGVIRPGGVSELVVGELDGSATDRVHALAAVLPELVVASRNVTGAIWSKRALAAMYTATALADADTATLIDRHRPAMLALAREVVHIAQRRGVALADLGYFDPARLGADTTAGAELDRLVGWQHGVAKKRVGPFRDIALRGRRTEAHTELADLAAAGRAVDVATPHLERLDVLLTELETRRRPFGEENFADLDPTRPLDRKDVPA
jgi:2-dehydropantoate 2-reductase